MGHGAGEFTSGGGSRTSGEARPDDRVEALPHLVERDLADLRVDAVRQQNGDEVALRVDPDGGPGEAGVAESSRPTSRGWPSPRPAGPASARPRASGELGRAVARRAPAHAGSSHGRASAQTSRAVAKSPAWPDDAAPAKRVAVVDLAPHDAVPEAARTTGRATRPSPARTGRPSPSRPVGAGVPGRNRARTSRTGRPRAPRRARSSGAAKSVSRISVSSRKFRSL